VLTTQSHIRFFDIVRALAAQAVLLGHLRNVVFPRTFLVEKPGGRLAPPDGVFQFENIGVLAFFIISGFLIAKTAQKSVMRGGNLGEFMIARAARIGTPYIVLLAILLVVERLLYVDGQNLKYMIVELDWQTFWLNCLMLFNNPAMNILSNVTGTGLLSAGTFGTFAQAWTLVIEWWIYLVFGVLYYTIRQPGRWTLPRLALLAFSLIVPLYSLVHGNALVIAWVIGMTCLIFHDRLMRVDRSTKLLILFWCTFIAIARCAVTRNDLYDAIFVLFAGSGLMTLYFMTEARAEATSVGSRIVTFFSDISYSLYLTHLSVLIAAVHLFPALLDNPAAGVALFVLCNLVGFAFYWSVERHYPVVARYLTRLTQRREYPNPAA
jgi:peptidoglycan/LPS O-acetylase OafA/YrhL